MTGIIQAILSFFGVQSSSAANYIEDVFSTYLYTGTGAAQTITNGIDLAGKGGLLATKNRSASGAMQWTSNVTGLGSSLESDTNTTGVGVTTFGFNSNGYTINTTNARWNASSNSYVSWTFRDQAKFFDVVTYTGNGSNRTISHNLGSVPGCIIVKRTDTSGDWQVYHRSLANTQYLVLNATSAVATGATRWNSTTATDTVFSLGTDATVNANGGTYVAYLFAHNSGGFGASGTDNVITCGTYLGSNHRSKEIVTLGYEPQWVMVKNISSTGQRWVMVDNMRGMANTGSQAWLFANSNVAETTTAADQVVAASTGFFFNGPQSDINEAGSTFIYIAIRRGPMKTPTSGTSVFSPVARTGTGAIANVTCGFAPDMVGMAEYPAAIQTGQKGFTDKLRGGTQIVYSSNTTGELASGDITQFQNNGVTLRASGGDYNVLNALYINWFFQRAPSFFDIVCYTGTGSNTTQTHNLAVVPELILVKGRSAATAWQVYSSALANNEYLVLNTTAAKATGATRWNSTTPTSSVFSLGTASEVNTSAATYMAYLFASCPGVSKVGSYTGTGTTLQVNCGFSAGSRFVMIKRTDSTGDWYVWDSARGIVSGNDPYLLLNSTAAEVTNTDYVDTSNAGFEISSTAPAAINANGGTFIFLAIA